MKCLFFINRKVLLNILQYFPSFGRNYEIIGKIAPNIMLNFTIVVVLEIVNNDKAS